MSLFMIFCVALKALGRNKMRTALTMLGLIIGVAAVITMVALGNGAQKQIEEQVQSGGTNLIMVRAGSFNRHGISGGMGSSPRLKAKDVDAIREQVSGAQYLTASVSTRDQVIAGAQNWQTRIEGADIELPLIRYWDVDLGTFFTATDVNSAAKVAVLGSIVRDNLFGEGSDPVGQTIRIRKQSFKIIGVMEAKGSGAFGQDQDDTDLRALHDGAAKAPGTGRHEHLRDHDLGALGGRHHPDGRADRGGPPRRARADSGAGE